MKRGAPPLEAVSSLWAMQSSRSQISALHRLGSFDSAACLGRFAKHATRTSSWLYSIGLWSALGALLLSLSSRFFRSKRKLSNFVSGSRLVVLSLSDSAESREGQVKQDSSSGFSAKSDGTQEERREVECVTVSANEMAEDPIFVQSTASLPTARLPSAGGLS